jgi:hypothetical protein
MIALESSDEVVPNAHREDLKMKPPPMAMLPSSMAETSLAMPPKHRHARANSHGKMAGHHGKGPKLVGSTANQLNQEELARLQAGNFSNPSAPPAWPRA